MKKLTDESVAKALGWTRKFLNGAGWQLYSPSGKFVGYEDEGALDNIPHYTTSLDVIVAEIEARGIPWGVAVSAIDGEYLAVYTHTEKKYRRFDGRAKTAPLALCAALLAYLKEAHHE